MDIDEREDLYQRARSMDPAAWKRLESTATSDLARWLRRREARLTPTRSMDVAEDAFSRASPEFPRIPEWPAAWTYLVKTARSVLKDASSGRPQADGALHGVRDDRALERLRAIDSSADLQALWRRVDRASGPLGNLFLELIEQVERGEAPSLRAAAAELGLSVRTVERRRRALRDVLRKLAREGGWPWLAVPRATRRPSV